MNEIPFPLNLLSEPGYNNHKATELLRNFSINRLAANKSYMLGKIPVDLHGLGPQNHTLVYESDEAQEQNYLRIPFISHLA